MTAPAGSRLGKAMLVLAWIAGLVLASRFFDAWLQRRDNPNAEPTSIHAEGHVEVRLQGDGQGHYSVGGAINGEAVTFLLDTGATDVAIPQALAERLGLPQGERIPLVTANGRSDGYRTRLDSLRIGDIELHDVRALVAPGFESERVLLGMSALRRLEFTQRDGTLVLRQYTQP